MVLVIHNLDSLLLGTAFSCTPVSWVNDNKSTIQFVVHSTKCHYFTLRQYDHAEWHLVIQWHPSFLYKCLTTFLQQSPSLLLILSSHWPHSMSASLSWSWSHLTRHLEVHPQASLHSSDILYPGKGIGYEFYSYQTGKVRILSLPAIDINKFNIWAE